jgi:hypothetical protein
VGVYDGLMIRMVVLIGSLCGFVRTMCGSRTGGWSLSCVMSD